MRKQTAIIIGAGPAGLTAALELLKKTDIKPVIFEKSNRVGGLAKTVNYKGYKIDIGPHRFFSKSEKVMKWWQEILPIQGSLTQQDVDLEIAYQNKKRKIHLSPGGPDPEKEDKVMLVKNRFTRILYNRKLFEYPVKPTIDTLLKLGIVTSLKILLSYLYQKLFPVKNVNTLEDFLINRFGKVLYRIFFKDYTYKVWGISCSELSPEWGTQRIKDLSVSKAIMHSIKKKIFLKKEFDQKNIQTTLIEHFLYPKLGTGQMWEEVAKKVIDLGGEIYLNHCLKCFELKENEIVNCEVNNFNDHSIKIVNGNYFFSTLPIKEMIMNMKGVIPNIVTKTASGLQYRDFVSVGMLVKKINFKNMSNVVTENNIIPDNWIYVQEKEVKLGRIVIYNNFSPYMLKKNENNIWLGLDYFCSRETDPVWNLKDDDIIKMAINELILLNMVNREDILDHVVIREANSYPVYHGTYKDFKHIKEFTNNINNLFLIGRNGMHRYNNQDHSMLTAMKAVENIINKDFSKENIWDVNAEDEHIEG